MVIFAINFLIINQIRGLMVIFAINFLIINCKEITHEYSIKIKYFLFLYIWF